MFCLSSSDSAFCLSRYSPAPARCPGPSAAGSASSLLSQSSMFCVVWSLTCQVLLDVLVDERVGRQRRERRIRAT